MKRSVFAIVLILALAALTLWGNRLVGHTLDAELASLLTRQLGLPVQLAPIKANLWQLQASSPKLIMGDPQDPAVVAAGVSVTLEWSDLLAGEVRLVSASAADLMVRPSRWPVRSTPPPNDYRFLDPWLPRSLQLQSGRFVSDGGDSYPITGLQWQRRADGSFTANWAEARTAGEISVNATLKSLADLLQLAPVELELDLAIAGKPDSAIALKARAQPGTASAYAMQIELQAAAMSAHIAATGQTPWALPDQSETTIPLLDIKQLQDLVAFYAAPDPDGELSSGLAASLPHIELPTHQGHVAIDIIRMTDEVGQDTAFDFTSGEQGLQISALTSRGPTGVLSGELGVISDAQGWAVNVDATMQAREGEADMAPQFGGSDWLWRTGRANLTGRGDTFGALLNSLQGDLALAGHYRNKNKIPVAIEARLDNRPEEFALDKLAITLGELHISGTALLSGTDRRKLTLDLKGKHMDLGFLFDTTDTQPLPGIAMPEYLTAMQDLDLNLTLNAENLQAPGLSLRQASATLERTEQVGRLVATARGTSFGSLDLALDASTPLDQPADVKLTANFADMDIPEIFRQKGLINSRSSGSLHFYSRGRGITEVFTGMQGKATLEMEVRADNDWRRRPIAQEKLSLSGNARLILDNERIVGIKIEELDVDSIDQEISGSLELVSNRSPWLVADLTSEMLNVTGLLALLPESTAKADQSGLVPSLKRLGAAQISLDARSLTVSDASLSNVRLEVASAPNLMTIQRFDFVSRELTLKTRGKMTWQGQRARLESTAQLANVDLDQFLLQHGAAQSVPVSGTIRIQSEGSRIDELVSNATGDFDLQADGSPQNAAPQARRKLTMQASRLPNGVQADISSLQWGESNLAGRVRYQRTTPPTVEIELSGGQLSLLPWENAYLSGDTNDRAPPSGSMFGSIARTSASLVWDVLLSPLKFLTRDTRTRKGDRIFSTDPLPLDSLEEFDLNVSGRLDSLLSTAVTANDIRFTGSLTNGQLALQASSGRISDGKGEFTLALDSRAAPPTFKLTSTFENMLGLVQRDTYPRSGFVSMESRGRSQAELAANATGLMFLELGRGPFDYANSALLTANLATTIFQTLIPGINRQQHELQCGVTLALVQDGMVNTPYGFAVRTNQADMVANLAVDLRKENLEMNIDARGRQGLGVSVGSVFSNTVRIRGPLSDPSMVPNPTGIAWRTWAAVSTGGLSILGEALLRRVWASDNPCNSIRRIIVEQQCPKNPVAASSPLVCPRT